MPKRTALLINCSKDQADGIREHAASQRRPVSGYVLNIATRAIAFEERFAKRGRLSIILPAALRPPGPRTTMLVRCAREEAALIRGTAKRHDTTISAYMLFVVQRAWGVADQLAKGRLPAVPIAPRRPSTPP